MQVMYAPLERKVFFSKGFFNEAEGLGMWNQLVKKVVLANANYASSKRVLDLHGAYWGNISWS